MENDSKKKPDIYSILMETASIIAKTVWRAVETEDETEETLLVEVIMELLEEITEDDRYSNDFCESLTHLILIILERKSKIAKKLVPRILEYLRTRNRRIHPSWVFEYMLKVLEKASGEYPEMFLNSIDVLLSLMLFDQVDWTSGREEEEWDDFITSKTHRELIIDILNNIWRQYPEIIEDALSDFFNNFDMRRFLVAIISEIAEKCPHLAKSGIPILIESISYDDFAEFNTWYSDLVASALKILGREYPELVREAVKGKTQVMIGMLNTIHLNAFGYDTLPDKIEIFKEIVCVYPEIIKDMSLKLPEVIDKALKVDEKEQFCAYFDNLMLALQELIIEFPELVEHLIPKLISRLDDPNPIIRENAIGCIRLIGIANPEIIKSAIPKLMEKLKDEEKSVRYAAEEALEVLGYDVEE